jgi:competence protein ComEC
MPWGLAALALMPLGLHGLALAPMGWGISGLLWVAHGVAAWPDARVAVPQMPAAALVLMLLGLVWLCVWRSRARLAGLGVMAAGLLVAVCAVPPDVLVDGDARVVAVRLGGRVLVSLAPGVSRFDREAPGRLWGVARTEPFPAEECGAASCRIDVHGWPVVLMQGAGAPCPAASVVVSHRRVVCPSGPIVDRAAVAAQGATTIWLNAGGPVMRTVAGERDGRPWVVPGAVPAPVRLPAALTE